MVCDERGVIRASATAPHTSHHPHPGWSEQDPVEWWQATVHAVQTAMAQVDHNQMKQVFWNLAVNAFDAMPG